MGTRGCVDGLEHPLFSKAAAALGFFCGWTGPAFWRERPSRRTTRDIDCGHMLLSKRSSMKRHRSGSVQAQGSPFSGSGPRRMWQDVVDKDGLLGLAQPLVSVAFGPI